MRVTVDVPGARYAAGPDGAAVPFTVTNRGADTVGLVACGGVQVVADRRDGDQWVEPAMFCQAIYSQVPVPLAPGARYAGAAVVRGPGAYRLRVGAAPLRNRDGPDVLALPVSGTFVVE